MTSSNRPKIEPHKIQEFNVKQSKYEMVGKLATRAIICGPSGSGKTVLLQSMILDIYRGCFSRIYIFSPSINVDYTWIPVKEYISKEMKVEETDTDKFYYDHYDFEALNNIISTQHKIVDYMKKHGYKKLHQILIIVDDMADDPRFTRQSKLLHQLYIRGRHNAISTITSVQKYFCLAPIIRINCTQLYVYKLRNYKDLESTLEELSAIYDKKTLLEIYNKATEAPYSFLYVNLVAPKKEDMFYIKFNEKIVVN